jgi:hypothetical protein
MAQLLSSELGDFTRFWAATHKILSRFGPWATKTKALAEGRRPGKKEWNA